MTQQPSFDRLKNIRIVLVHTSHPGNIGAAARAMKNMGLSQLCLVSPALYPSYEAYSRAAGADDILNAAVVVESLQQAIGDCVWVAGASARSRTIEWPVQTPAECALTGLDKTAEGDIAIVFGRERSGLTNEELAQCNALVHIPTNADYSSLNVAAAVQILCYECRLAVLNEAPSAETPRSKKHRDDVAASAGQLDGLYTHLYEALTSVSFFGTRESDVVMRRLKAVFNRAALTQREVAIFRGICSAMQGKKMARIQKPGIQKSVTQKPEK
ncbi:MAG TPA: RNA methyltransferase [Thiotrichales bacterium]|nr:RNA methyltransferase [Thiotrichales bacterium]